MFSFIKRQRETPISVLVEKPKPILSPPGSETLDTYEQLAGELGFNPAQLIEERLVRFLATEGIPTYDYDQVNAYMTAVAEADDKVWIWRPLREQDKPQGWEWGGKPFKGNENSWRGHGSYHDEWNYRPYNKAIPIHILRQVKKIQDHFGNSVLFFVSDYAVPNPDPFIMVTALDVRRTVFGVWDEPSFGTE
jgi:hypothetical protein